MNCPDCKTPMDLYAANRERHYVCPKCNKWVDRTPPMGTPSERTVDAPAR